MNREYELLDGMNDDELEALSDSMLAPSAQARLDELLAQNAEGAIGAAEQAELERLVARVDLLTVLKTRARLTLSQRTGVTGS